MPRLNIKRAVDTHVAGMIAVFIAAALGDAPPSDKICADARLTVAEQHDCVMRWTTAASDAARARVQRDFGELSASRAGAPVPQAPRRIDTAPRPTGAPDPSEVAPDAANAPAKAYGPKRRP